MKRFLRLTLIIVFAILLFLVWNIWLNNRNIEPVTQPEIKQHFNKSVTWLVNNYSTIENNHNPILWWMLKQASLNTGNHDLTTIYTLYKKNHLDKNPPNLSTPMFDKFYQPRVPDITQLSKLRDYQVFFFYGLSCDSDLGSEPIIQKQMLSGFCALHYLHPRCITHQVMGLRFMQRYQCGYDDKINHTISELQKVILSELTWDFRVGDAYIQRVLMLADTGAFDRVKPIWLKRILDAQDKDGSWDDLHPVIYLGNDYVLAHTSLLPKIAKPKADFHATAQAIWLLSLLLNNNLPGQSN